MDKEEAVGIALKYTDRIKEFFNLKKVILFGSYARNTNKKFSDIDVAVVVDKIDSLLNSEFLLHKLVRDVDLRIEPVLFEEGYDPSGFLEEINRTGIIIYQSN
jgi:predicted nucleotidyltransferase